MTKNFHTSRLSLQILSQNDAIFILELMNTPGWLQFIGDRNVKNEQDALTYIQKISDNPDITYWVVKLNADNASIGIITFIKRDYLEHYDIGFAFLPQYAGQGFAFEAARIVLKDALTTGEHQNILATTMQENISSIKLLGRLGFTFKKIFENNGEKALLYSFAE